MRHGLYKVEFHTPRGTASGVLFVTDGKFRGGDSGFYYVGTYTESGDEITGSVSIKRHTAGVNAMIGEQATITLAGAAKGDTASLRGTVVGVSGISFEARVQWLTD